MHLNSAERLNDLTVICRPLSSEGLQTVINHAIAIYMEEQGITEDDIRKLALKNRRQISEAFIDGTLAFAPDDAAFKRFLLAAQRRPAKRP